VHPGYGGWEVGQKSAFETGAALDWKAMGQKKTRTQDGGVGPRANEKTSWKKKRGGCAGDRDERNAEIRKGSAAGRNPSKGGGVCQ